jgi:hypothetical protein
MSEFITQVKIWVDSFFDNNENRWWILFISVIASYVYLIYNAYTSSGDDQEKIETSLLINPSKGGYRKDRGNLSSPSLFEWNASEICMIIMGVVWIIASWFYFVYYRPNPNQNIRLIEFFVISSHLILLWMLIPVNDFHKRILYNGRSLAAQVCNNSMKELWMAFLFIVVLPIPGSTSDSRSHSKRMTWMLLKLGLFYIVQNILLGSPNYKIEPAAENKIISESSYELLGYGLLVAVMFLMYFFEKLNENKQK